MINIVVPIAGSGSRFAGTKDDAPKTFLRQTLGTPFTDLIAALKCQSRGVGARLRHSVETHAKNERDRRNRRRLQKLMEARVALLSYCSGPIFPIHHLRSKAQ